MEEWGRKEGLHPPPPAVISQSGRLCCLVLDDVNVVA